MNKEKKCKARVNSKRRGIQSNKNPEQEKFNLDEVKITEPKPQTQIVPESKNVPKEIHNKSKDNNSEEKCKARVNSKRHGIQSNKNPEQEKSNLDEVKITEPKPQTQIVPESKNVPKEIHNKSKDDNSEEKCKARVNSKRHGIQSNKNPEQEKSNLDEVKITEPKPQTQIVPESKNVPKEIHNKSKDNNSEEKCKARVNSKRHGIQSNKNPEQEKSNLDEIKITEPKSQTQIVPESTNVPKEILNELKDNNCEEISKAWVNTKRRGIKSNKNPEQEKCNLDEIKIIEPKPQREIVPESKIVPKEILNELKDNKSEEKSKARVNSKRRSIQSNKNSEQEKSNLDKIKITEPKSQTQIVPESTNVPKEILNELKDNNSEETCKAWVNTKRRGIKSNKNPEQEKCNLDEIKITEPKSQTKIVPESTNVPKEILNELKDNDSEEKYKAWVNTKRRGIKSSKNPEQEKSNLDEIKITEPKPQTQIVPESTNVPKEILNELKDNNSEEKCKAWANIKRRGIQINNHLEQEKSNLNEIKITKPKPQTQIVPESENAIKDKLNKLKGAGERNEHRKLAIKLDVTKSDVKSIESEIECIVLYDTGEDISEKSISTMNNNSPITAHGYFDEPPPDLESMNEIFKPRNVEVEKLDQSMQDFHNILMSQIIETSYRKSETSVENVEPEIYGNNGYKNKVKSNIAIPINSPKTNYFRNSKMADASITNTKKDFGIDHTSKRSTSKKGKALNIDINNKLKVTEDTEALTTDSPSISRVEEWFQHNVHAKSSIALMHNDVVSDCIGMMSEKLNTTLVEFTEETSRRLVDMFVETYVQIRKYNEEQNAMHKNITSNLVNELNKIMNARFMEMDKEHKGFTKNFKDDLVHSLGVILRETTADIRKKSA